MTLVCRPVGRGNWHTLTIIVHGSDLFRYQREQRFDWFGATYRIAQVLP